MAFEASNFSQLSPIVYPTTRTHSGAPVSAVGYCEYLKFPYERQGPASAGFSSAAKEALSPLVQPGRSCRL